jgi:hypothetical protein
LASYLDGWTLFALFFISKDAGRLLCQGHAVEWHGYLVVSLTTAYVWARSVRVVACAAHAHRPRKLVAQRRNFVATFRAVVPIDFHLNVIIYWLIVGVQHGVGYYRRLLERERLSAQLQLQQARHESIQRSWRKIRFNEILLECGAGSPSGGGDHGGDRKNASIPPASFEFTVR